MLKKADKQLEKKNYRKAKTFYDRVRVLTPGDHSYAKEKVYFIDSIFTAKNDSIKALAYNQLIAKADTALHRKDFISATHFYQEALYLIPYEPYPQMQLYWIEHLKHDAYQNELFSKIITRADSNFQHKKFTDAKQYYEDALRIKPNEAYPKQQLQLIDSIITK